MIHVQDVKVESDEQGFELHLWVDEEIGPAPDDDGYQHLILNVHGVAEELYDAVKNAIGPWLYERDMARATMPATLTDAEREEEVRCAALGMEGPNAKQYRHETWSG